MSIIANNNEGKAKSSINVELSPKVLEQIKLYCRWAGVYDLGYFFEKAANEILLNDSEWLLFQQTNNYTEPSTTPPM